MLGDIKNMMPYLLQIGSFELRYYSLMYIIGLLLSIYLAKRRAKQLGVKPEIMENIVILIFIFSIIGARFYYVVFNWDYYAQDPLSAFAIWKGGLAIHGGVIAGAISAIFIQRYYKLAPLFTLDIIAPLLLLSQGIGRFGNFANGEAHGVPTITPPEIIFRIKPIFAEFWTTTLTTLKLDNTPESISSIAMMIKSSDIFVNFYDKAYQLKEYVPWGISFPPTYMPPAYLEFGTLPVHPTFFYEMILNFIFAGLMLYFFWRKDKYIGSGVILGSYFISYGFIRGFITFFRADDLMWGMFRAPHVASIGFVILGVVLVIRGYKKTKGVN